MKDWLRRELAPYRSSIAYSCFFGSILDQTLTPRDIDIVLVTNDAAGHSSWHSVRKARDAIELPFYETFGLPLSAMVLTPSEWKELDGIIVRERESLWPAQS